MVYNESINSCFACSDFVPLCAECKTVEGVGKCITCDIGYTLRLQTNSEGEEEFSCQLANACS